MNTTKKCPGPLCLGKEKLISEFYKNKARSDGLSVYCKKCHTVEMKPRQDALRQDVINYLGGKCIKCDWSDSDSLHIDHIDGGGLRERKVLSPMIMYKKILSGEPGYQLLCANHNMKKRVENDERYHADKIVEDAEPWFDTDGSWMENAPNFMAIKKGSFTKGDKWSIKYDVCINCETADRPHKGGGLCMNCYMQWKRGKSDIGPASNNRRNGVVVK